MKEFDIKQLERVEFNRSTSNSHPVGFPKRNVIDTKDPAHIPLLVSDVTTVPHPL